MAVGINKMPIMVSESSVNRFWGKVKITANHTLCWGWDGSKNKVGYGYITVKNDEGAFIKLKAHRLSYYLHYKKDPHELLVMHKCDNPQCCNPHHLELGTDKTNAEDRDTKGRGNKGEKNGQSKRTKEEVLEIRKLYAEGVSARELAEKFNTLPNSITCIASRRYWKHI